MTQTLLTVGIPSGLTLGTSSQWFPGFGSGLNATTAISSESLGNVTWHIGGTVSSLYTRVDTNAATGSSTVNFRNNASSGNQVLNISPSSTGETTDVTHSDTFSSGNKLNTKWLNGGGGSIVLSGVNYLMTPTSSGTAYNRLMAGGNASYSGASSIFFEPLFGRMDNGASSLIEADTQFNNKNTATLNNLFVMVTAPAGATVKTRVSGSSGNLSVVITSSSTGIIEDTTHSDSLVTGNLINYSISPSSASPVLIQAICCDYSTTSGYSIYGSASPGSFSITSSTRWLCIAGLAASPATIEASSQLQALISFTASSLETYCELNSLTASSTISFRKNASSGNLSITISPSSTGYFEDITHSDSVVSTDEINYQIAAGAGTSSKFPMIGFTAGYISTTLLTTDNIMPFSTLALPQHDDISRFEFLARQQDDDNDRFEFLSKQQNDSVDRLEFLARQQDDDTDRLEILTAQLGEEKLPFDNVSAAGTTLTIDELMPFEFQALIQEDIKQLEEFVTILPQNINESFESVLTAQIDRNLQDEITRKQQIDAVNPYESLAKQQNDGNQKYESVTAANKDITIRQEIVYKAQKDDSIPYENISTSQALTTNELLSYEFTASQKNDVNSTLESIAKQSSDAGLVLDYNLLSQINALYPLENIIPVNTRQAISYEWLLELLVTKDNLLPLETQALQQKDTNARFEFRHTNSVIGAVVLMDKIKHLLVLRDSAKFVASLNAIKMKYSVTNSDAPKFTVTLTDKPTAKVKLS